MSEHLPDVKVTPEQEARAVAMANEMSKAYWGYRSSACVIVHLQDRVAELERHLNKAEIERAWAIGMLRKPAHEREAPHCSSCSCGMPAETTPGAPT